MIAVESLRRISEALETIASCVKNGVLQMRDVDRAQVYSKHLGKKLRKKPRRKKVHPR